ncbi:MAG: hypothetical protein HY559_04060 [Gammaproteobacteria bacterium]|nr:hypothetical protein [Gammaproteobacteria bacterium]
MASPVHYLEIDSIPEMSERIEVLSILRQYAVKLTNYEPASIKARSEYFYTKKIGVADAVHVAFAEKSSEVFITCDDRLLKQCGKLKLKLKTMNPVEFTILENLQ